MSPQMKHWLIGLANSVISGAVAAAGSFVAGITFKQGAIIVGISAAGSLVKWLKQNPIPDGQDKPQPPAANA